MLTHTIESLEGVNESHHELYEQSGDKYKLKVDLSGSGFEEVSGLKSAKQAIQLERNTLREEVAKLRPLAGLLDVEGFDPSSVEDLMAKAANATDPEAIDKITRQHEKRFETVNSELQAAKQAADNSKKEMEDYIIANELMSAAVAADILKGSEKDAVSLTRGEFRYVDGSVIHVDADGDPTGLTPSEFYKTTNREKRAYLYSPIDMSGSGSKTSRSGNADGSNLKRSAMTSKQKTEYIGKHGQQNYLNLPK